MFIETLFFCRSFSFVHTQIMTRRASDLLPRLGLVFSLVAALTVVAHAQNTSPTPTPVTRPTPNPVLPGTGDEKSEQIIKRAIEVVGGDRYLNVRTIVGRGFFTGF